MEKPDTQPYLRQVLEEKQSELLRLWKENLKRNAGRQTALMSDTELDEQCSRFLKLLSRAVNDDHLEEQTGEDWTKLKEFLAEISKSRSTQGYSPTEVATFIFSAKDPLFSVMQKLMEGKEAGDAQLEQLWRAGRLLDALGLFTTENYMRAREEVIRRQQQDLLELSTPVVSLWDGILALPLIGTLDSERTQVVMESLLQRIVETEADVAIIDITGVPAVDTLVAQHLIKTVTAARLMGADCIISGIRPQIAQTIVHLGVDLGNITTKSSLAAAFGLALARRRMKVTTVG